MPKNKFDSFYYGIGMKLDEASIDQTGKRLEGKLNKVVDNVAQKVASIYDAVLKGATNVDTKDLVKSLAEAQQELNHFQDFDPSKLQHQIEGLNKTVNNLTDNLGEVTEKLRSFTNDVSTRLSNIEILTPKMGTDALKKDILEMKNIVSNLNEISKTSEIDIPTDLLEASVKKIKDGLASIQASGNSLELFSDRDIAKNFVAITNLLRNIGNPVASLKKEFVDLASVFNDKFADDNVAKIFKNNLGYQIESETLKLERAKDEIKQYKNMIDSLNSTTRDWQKKLSSLDSGLIDTFKSNATVENLDIIIKKIEEYKHILFTLEDVQNVDYRNAMENMLALIQSTEKTMSSIDKKKLNPLLSVWKNAFDGSDLESGNKLSVLWLEDYRDNIKIAIKEIESESEELEKIIRKTQDRLYMLEGREKEQIPKTQKKTTKTSKKNIAQGIAAEVEAKIKINKAEWAKTINAALKNIETKNKVKPFKIKVEATQGKILDEIKKIKEETLMDKKNNGDKDVVSFNKNFDKFIGNLKTRKQELIDELKQNWYPAIKDAFSFRIEILGLDKKSMTENIATNVLPIVDSINDVIESKPLIFHSNIDTLVEEIKSKLQDIKIDIGAGNIAVSTQGLSNANIIINGIVGGGTAIPFVQPTSSSIPSSQPSTPVVNNGEIDKQVIYNDAASRIKEMLDNESNPTEALKKVKQAAHILYKQLINADEGTQEYYEAQIQLATLLSKWRYKIGGPKANEAFKVSGVMGKGKKYTDKWNQYLIDNGILPNIKNDRIIHGTTALEKLYDLKKPSSKSNNKAPKVSKNNSVITAEEQMANELEAGKKIVNHYIKLAKWAKALGPIAESADIEIKESDFKDTDTIKRRGNYYTKEDIGTVIPGDKISFEDLDAFIDQYEQAANEEEKQLFGFLKNLIDAYRDNKQKLDSLLEELSGSEAVYKYDSADNKTETLATDIKSSYKKIMSKNGSKKAQQHLTDTFEKYNIDLSKLPDAKTYAEQWQIIQQQIIGRKGLDFDGLMSELGSLKGNVGKTYENFMTLLKVSRAYMLATNSLDEVGQEAALLIRGKREKSDREIKKYNPSTGRSEGTGEYIKSNKIVEEGLRQEISKLAVVFVDKLGNAIAGFNAGKNIADDYLGSASSSFSKIIKFLTDALGRANTIAFDQYKRGTQGYQGVTKWNAANYEKSTNKNKNFEFTTATTEASTIEGYIKGTESVINSKKMLKNKLLEENKKIQETITILENKNDKTEEENQQLQGLKKKIKNNNDTITECINEINKQQARLPGLRENLKKADKKNVEYKRGNRTVTYDQAESDLPRVKIGGKSSKSKLKQLEQDFALKYIGFASELNKDEINKITPKLKVPKFNEQFLSGELKEEEYIKKVENAYIILNKAKTEEAKATAKADAKKIIDATILIKKYQEEEAILQKIIRTQKPKEQLSTQSVGQRSGKPKYKSQNVTQTTSRNISTSVGNIAPTEVNGNIIANIAGTGLATEGTVRAIYNLLSIRKNGEYDSKIEELKNAIAKKKEENRKKTEQNSAVKKTEEKISKKTIESNNKKENNTQTKTQLEAEKKKTEETKKQVENENKKTEESKKQSENESKKTVEDNKNVTKSTKKSKEQELSTSINDILQSKKKDKQELWTAIRKTQQNVDAGNKLFREHSFALYKDKVKDVRQGTYAQTAINSNLIADTYGHMHPRNSVYSGADINNIIRKRKSNSTYDVDTLITPDFIYTLKGLSKVDPEALNNLKDIFNTLESIYIPQQIRDTAKETALYNFAQKNDGVQYSRNKINSDGTLSNITESTTRFSKEVLDKLIQYIETTIEFRATKKDDPKYQSLSSETRSLLSELKKDDIYNLVRSSDEELTLGASKEKMDNTIFSNATILQTAIDRNWDLKYFYDNLCILLDAIEQAGKEIPPDSVLAKIKNTINNVRLSSSDISEQSKVMDTIKPDLIRWAGYNPTSHLDDRVIEELRAKANIDSTGQISKDLQKMNNQRGNVVNESFYNIDDLMSHSIEDLQAEIARLEILRDSGDVDPRFATAEKQDIIIDLLKNGVKVAGKGNNIGGDGEDSQSKKNKEPKKASQGETINNARKEVDSANGAASTTVKDTGDTITKTAQKCGAEILTITETVKNGVKNTTASINNDYETAMKKTNEQIGVKANKGLFGAPYNADINVEATDAQTALNKYTETYANLQKLISEFKSLDLSTNSGKTKASKLQSEIDLAQKELDEFEGKLINIANNTDKFLGGKEAFAIMSPGALDQTGMSLKLLAQDTENAMVAFNGLYNDGTKLIYDVFDPATSSFKRYALEVDKTTGYVRKMETAQTGLVNAFQNVNKVQRQSADVGGIDGINIDANIIKQYNEAKENLNKIVDEAWTNAKSNNRLISLDEQKEIYAASNEILRLGKRILSTANSFKTFEAEGGRTFEVIREKAESLEDSMRKIAVENALDDKMSISNISYNEATKKMTYDLTDLEGNVRRVTMAYVEMFNQVKITSDNNLASVDKISAGIREDLMVIGSAVDSGLIDTRTNEYLEYEKSLKELSDYKDQLDAKDDALTQNEIDNLNQRKKAVKSLGEELIAMAKKNKRSMGQGSRDVTDEINQKNTIDVGVDNFSALANTQQYQSYIRLYDSMIAKQDEFRQQGVLAGQSEQDELSRIAKSVRLARTEFEQLAKISASFDSKVVPENVLGILGTDDLEQEMKQLVLSQEGLTSRQKEMIESTWSFKNAQDGATYSVLKGKDQVASMSVIFDQGTRRIGQYTVETNKYRTSVEKFLSSLKGKWQEVARYLMSFGSLYQVWGVLKQGITYVKEIDSALTELKKVTDETEATYDKFLNTAAKTADKVGSTIKEVVSSTADWARLGYSLEDAANLAESTSVLLNVSEFQSIDDATSALVSTMQAFGYAAEDSIHVVDVMNEIGNNYAVSSDGIATALQDSASSLMAANNSYQEAVSLIAAANRVVILRHGL